MNQIVTGEAVAIDIRVARLGSRMIAAFLDLFIMFFALYFVGIGAVVVVQPEDDALAAAVGILVYVGVFVGYPVACETLMRGRTFGKMMMGLRVVRDDGGPIRFRHAFVRGLVGVVAERPGLLLFLPGVASMLVSTRSKRIGDVLAGTVVLQESVPRTMGAAPRMPPELASWAAMLDLTQLDDALVFSVRRLLSRAGEMSPEARDAVATQLAAEVRKVVTPAPPPWTNGWSYLSAVLAERTRRAYYRLLTRSTTATGTSTYGTSTPHGFIPHGFAPNGAAQTWPGQPVTYPPAAYPPSAYPLAAYPPAQQHPNAYPPAAYPPAQQHPNPPAQQHPNPYPPIGHPPAQPYPTAYPPVGYPQAQPYPPNAPNPPYPSTPQYPPSGAYPPGR